MCMTCTINTYAHADAKTEIYEPLIKSEAGFVTYEGSLKKQETKKVYVDYTRKTVRPVLSNGLFTLMRSAFYQERKRL